MFSQKASTASTSPARREGLEPWAADLLDEARAGPARIPGAAHAGRDRSCGPRPEAVGPSSRATSSMRALRAQIQSVAGLHLDRGDALGISRRARYRRRRSEFGRVGRAGGIDGRLNAAAGAGDLLVRRAAQPLLEFLDSVAAVHQVGMAIDEPRRDPQPAAIHGRMPTWRPCAVLLRRVRSRRCARPSPRAHAHALAIGFAARDHSRDVCADPHLVPLAIRRHLSLARPLPASPSKVVAPRPMIRQATWLYRYRQHDATVSAGIGRYSSTAGCATCGSASTQDGRIERIDTAAAAEAAAAAGGRTDHAASSCRACPTPIAMPFSAAWRQHRVPPIRPRQLLDLAAGHVRAREPHRAART